MTCQDSSQLCSNSDFYHVGLLWVSVLHRYALYCNVVRGRLLTDQQNNQLKSKIWIREAGAGSSQNRLERFWTAKRPAGRGAGPAESNLLTPTNISL